jgi:glycosyltransferase involved in cell wall biosynthesis
MEVLHLTFDHPDGIVSNKTKAVRNLYSTQEKVKNLVFSMNRSWFPFSSYRAFPEEHGYTMRLFGLPLGVLLHLWMYLAARKIRRVVLAGNHRPDLIHAHKLTFEGIIARYLSRMLGIPYIMTIRGNTDLVVMKHKPLSGKRYQRVIAGASYIFFLAPWTLKKFHRRFGSQLFEGKAGLMPNVVEPRNQVLHQGEINPRFVTVFRLHFLKGKNIRRIIKAFDRIMEEHPGTGLDIIGEGHAEQTIRSLIKKSKYPDRYALLGKVENHLLVEKLSSYTGFILPSFPETFGLVFIEALIAGIPIIYTMDSGVDGYFDQFTIGIRVRHTSVREIATAIDALIRENPVYRVNISNMRETGFFDQFTRARIRDTYYRVIRKSINAG